jgi:hypothetical protein
MRRHAKRLTILTCVAGLFLGLVLCGCSSASSGAAPGDSGSGEAGGSPGSTSSCDSAAYRLNGRAPVTAGRLVLAAVQLPDPVEIPDPDLDIIDEARPEGVSPDAEETWATTEAGAAQSVAAQQNQSSNQDLQTVSNEVSADEVSTILLDDVKEIEDGRDNYDEDLCKSIGEAIEKFGNALDYYDSLTQVVAYLDGLAVAYNSRAPLDMATAITDAQTRFQQALGVCVDNLETIHWIMEQIQNIFCNEGK